MRGRKLKIRLENLDEICRNNNDTVVDGVRDSPIKTFKPIGDSSLFQFDNQFEGVPPNERQKRKRVGRKLRRL